MKTELFYIATALFCLAACNKQEMADGPDDNGRGIGYKIGIAEIAGPVKSTFSPIELNLADLDRASDKSISAQLMKRSGGGSWANVNVGVIYSWSSSIEDMEKFSGSGTVSQSCIVSAKKAGSGIITVSAEIGGTAVATQSVPVNVFDDRALTWSNASPFLITGELGTVSLNSNFRGIVTVSSDNSGFLVGTSANNLGPTASVTFGSSDPRTIYVKYTDSGQADIKLKARSDSIDAELNISAGNLILADFAFYPSTVFIWSTASATYHQLSGNFESLAVEEYSITPSGEDIRIVFNVRGLLDFVESTLISDDLYIVIPRMCNDAGGSHMYDINEPDLYSLPGYSYLYMNTGVQETAEPWSGGGIYQAFSNGEISWESSVFAGGKKLIPGTLSSKWFSGIGINLKSLADYLKGGFDRDESKVIICDDIYISAKDGSSDMEKYVRVQLDFVTL